MLFHLLCSMTEILDNQLRIIDFRTRRTVGGPLHKLCNIRRHTAAALILPALFSGLLILGPSWHDALGRSRLGVPGAAL